MQESTSCLHSSCTLIYREIIAKIISVHVNKIVPFRENWCKMEMKVEVIVLLYKINYLLFRVDKQNAPMHFFSVILEVMRSVVLGGKNSQSS